MTGGEINTDGLGFNGGSPVTRGYGPGGGSNTATYGGGGGHGGMGGFGSNSASGGPTYGVLTNPAYLGSGGGGGASARGGAGGGYVKIVAAGTVTVDGVVSAKGTNNVLVSQCGGGSGGGISIRCTSLAGNGLIRADGGFGLSGGGGGGGGRIAVSAIKAPYYLIGIRYSAAGGTGYSNGLPGTIYLDFKTRGTLFSAW
jgi:hypothetical protein